MKILLLGANGQLGRELERQLTSVGSVATFPRSALDITNHRAVTDAVLAIRPNIIVNAAAYTAVDQAEQKSDEAFAINAEAVANLAQLAKVENALLIYYSTDYVFDGTKPTPYVETDTPNPINVYGASKLAGEQAIIDLSNRYLIFRTSLMLSNHPKSIALKIVEKAINGLAIEFASDQAGVPTSSMLIGKVTIDACKSMGQSSEWPNGIYHLVPRGVSNPYEIAHSLLSLCEEHSVSMNTQAKTLKLSQ